MTTRATTAVAVIGGGPAGAAVAAHLARAGIEVTLFERLARPRWRASGVYSSPLTRRRLLDMGLAPEVVGRLIRPIEAMVIRSASGDASARLQYPAPAHACGVDRVALESEMLEVARAAGATVLEGAAVRRLEFAGGNARLEVSHSGSGAAVTAALVVGADGPSSIVARAAGVDRPARRFRRAGLTVHRRDPATLAPGQPMEAEMIVGAGWYLGVAPVPRGRVNLGLVVSERHLRQEVHRRGNPSALVEQAVRRIPGPPRGWSQAAATDDLRVALPLAHRVSAAAGRRFVLVGDAAGFLDPLSGEGLQRALASAEMATDAITDWLRGDRNALSRYDRRLRARYRSKDVLSWLLQAFLASPPLTLRALRRLDRRPDMARALAAALADIEPATTVLDPRYLARLMG